MKTAAALILSVLATLSTALADEPKPSISVTGEAQLQVDPDEVVITLGVETRSRELSTAKTENDERMKKVILALQSEGVAKAGIQTDYFQAEPHYDHSTSESPRLYHVRNRIVVTLKDISAFERVLSRALESGADNVQGIDFRTSKLREHRDKARALAIRAAKEKAAALAGELDQQLGNPLTIVEQNQGFGSWYTGWWGMGMRQGMTQNVMQTVSSAGGSEDGTIAPGKLKITANVSVSFELKPHN